MKASLFFSFIFFCTFSFGQNIQQDSLVKIQTRDQRYLFPDSTIKRLLPGKWQDQNSTTVFMKKGGFTTTFRNSTKQSGSWDVEGHFLIFVFSREVGTGNFMPEEKETYKLLRFSPISFDFQLTNPLADTTVWHATRFEK